MLRTAHENTMTNELNWNRSAKKGGEGDRSVRGGVQQGRRRTRNKTEVRRETHEAWRRNEESVDIYRKMGFHFTLVAAG